MAAESYQKLIAWQRAMDLVESVYRKTAGFPEGERYGLTSQMRRAAVSVPSNIAEGHGRRHVPDFLRFLAIARGSVKELETQVIISSRLGFVNAKVQSELDSLTEEVSRLITGLMKSLKTKA